MSWNCSAIGAREILELDWKILSGGLSTVLGGIFTTLAGVGTLSAETGIVSTVVGSLVATGVSYYQSPKIRLKIVDFEVLGYEYGNFRGFQVKARVANSGKRIAERFGFTPKIMKVDGSTKLSRLTFALKSDQPLVVRQEDSPAEILPFQVQAISGELRIGDHMDVVFPYESVGGHQNSVALIEYKPGKYEFSIGITCEDPLNKTAHVKRKKVVKSLRYEDWPKYWLKHFPLGISSEGSEKTQFENDTKRLETIGIAQAREKQRLENIEKWKETYQRHSEQIGHTIFEAWNSKHVVASCSLDNYKFNYHEPQEPDPLYVGQARAHLRTGYPAIWTTYEDAKKRSLATLRRIQERVKSVEDLVVEWVEKSRIGLKKSEKWSPPIPRYYYVPGMLWAVVLGASGTMDWRFGHQNVNTEVIDESGVRSRRDLTELSFSGQSLGRGQASDMKQLQTVVESLMRDAGALALVKEYHGLVDNLAEQAKEFDRTILGMWSQIQAGRPLEGSCDLCPARPS